MVCRTVRCYTVNEKARGEPTYRAQRIQLRRALSQFRRTPPTELDE